MEFHPLSQIFPMMAEAELAELAEDIKVHGLRESIELYEDKIIDGRNRFAACEMAGVEPHFMPIGPPNEAAALAYVISKNLKRRHLTTSQRAAIATELANMREGRPSAETAGNQAVSQSDAAAMLNVSRDTVQRAVAVRNATADTPETMAAVKSGELTLSEAQTLAAAAPEERREITSLPKPERKAAVKRKKKQKQQKQSAPALAAQSSPAAPDGTEWKRASFEIRKMTSYLEGISQYCADLSKNMSAKCRATLLNPSDDQEEVCKASMLAAICGTHDHLTKFEAEISGESDDRLLAAFRVPRRPMHKLAKVLVNRLPSAEVVELIGLLQDHLGIPRPADDPSATPALRSWRPGSGQNRNNAVG
jgi:ParB-like chromosome segregation protein Spo0J